MMNSSRLLRKTCLALAVVWLVRAVPVCAQETEKPAESARPKIEIRDEPRATDPATVMPEPLAKRVTMDFPNSSLREVAAAIGEQAQMPVLFDKSALSSIGISLAEPVTDHLNDEPLYLALNRLRTLRLAWYVKDKVVWITSEEAASQELTTESYNVSDLIDAGYRGSALLTVIQDATSGMWVNEGNGDGDCQILADVLFIRATAEVQREVQGLLEALRHHGRETLVLDPPQHQQIREALRRTVTADFEEIPLSEAVDNLARQSGIDIRLDLPALRLDGIREREPVSLKLSDRSLETSLQILLADRPLEWMLQDGVLWITTSTTADICFETAVYDVRDLSTNQAESSALSSAVMSQTGGHWENQGDGEGVIEFPLPGTMVVRQSESVLQQIRNLLAMFRKALESSKPRQRENDPNEVVTRYYKMNEQQALDLKALLPRLVKPGTWETDAPPGPGSALVASTGKELLFSPGSAVADGTNEAAKNQTGLLVISTAVLIVRQTRAAQDEITEFLSKIDPNHFGAQMFGGVGGGGGGGGLGGGMGFGGGYFDVPGESP